MIMIRSNQEYRGSFSGIQKSERDMIDITRFAKFMTQCATLIMALSFFLTVLLFTNTALASKRVALVIGNSAYKNTTPLKNPKNDAEDIAQKLNELGFDVVSGFDLDSRGMRDKVREFGKKLAEADVAMFFYAGHALQVNGRNYLAPVSTDLRYESDLDFETIPMDFVQRQMERQSKTILMFLDACRDNPLARNLRIASRSSGSVRGLAREQDSAEGTFIAYATEPNNVALDGTGRNSPFTKALLENISRPGVEISTLMTDVRQQVYKETNKQQLPWINSSLLGRFYFRAGEETPEKIEKPQINSVDTNQQQTPLAEEKQPGSDKLTNMRVEQLAWDAVKDTKDKDELQAFIDAYGEGFFGNLARLRLAKLQQNSGQQIASAQTEEKRKIRIEQASPKNADEVKKVDDPVVIDDVQAKNIAEQKEEVTSTKEEAPANQQLALAVDPKKNDNLASEPEEAPKPMDRETIRLIQSELNRVGCVAGRPDGIWGKKSRRAVDLYNDHSKAEFVSAEPSHELLAHLKANPALICPPQVRPVPQKTTPKKPVKVVCRSGQKLSSRGKCYWPKKARQSQTRKKVIQKRQPTVVVPRNRKSGLLGGAVR